MDSLYLALVNCSTRLFSNTRMIYMEVGDRELVSNHYLDNQMIMLQGSGYHCIIIFVIQHKYIEISEAPPNWNEIRDSLLLQQFVLYKYS